MGKQGMQRRRFTTEQTVQHLREAEIHLSLGGRSGVTQSKQSCLSLARTLRFFESFLQSLDVFLQLLKLRREALASRTFRFLSTIFVHDSRKLNRIRKVRNPIESGNQLLPDFRQNTNCQMLTQNISPCLFI